MKLEFKFNSCCFQTTKYGEIKSALRLTGKGGYGTREQLSRVNKMTLPTPNDEQHVP